MTKRKVKVKQSDQVVRGRRGEASVAGQGEGNVVRTSRTRVERRVVQDRTPKGDRPTS